MTGEPLLASWARSQPLAAGGHRLQRRSRACRDGLRQSQGPAGVDAMTVTIGHLTFEHATYDEQGDVLYLQIGERQVAADSEETPEGHVLRFDATGKIIGLTIINAKWLLDRNGENRCHAARASARRALRARGCVRRRVKGRGTRTPVRGLRLAVMRCSPGRRRSDRRVEGAVGWKASKPETEFLVERRCRSRR